MVNLKGIGQKLVGARPEEMSLQEYLELAKKDKPPSTVLKCGQ